MDLQRFSLDDIETNVTMLPKKQKLMSIIKVGTSRRNQGIAYVTENLFVPTVKSNIPWLQHVPAREHWLDWLGK